MSQKCVLTFQKCTLTDIREVLIFENCTLTSEKCALTAIFEKGALMYRQCTL